MNVDSVLSSYKDMCIWTWMGRCWCVHRQVSAPTALQLANSAVRHVITSLNYEHAIYIFQWRIHAYAFCLYT